MRVFQSAVLRSSPGIAHATAPLVAQPLTFSGNSRTSVVQARARLLRTVGATLHSLILGHQVHGARVRIVDERELGAGARTPATYLTRTDGLLTQRPGVTLGVFTADCVPVLLADPVTGWIGALHVGWRGAVKGIASAALKLLRQHGVDLKNVQVWLGPAICGRHYTVDTKRGAKLAKAFRQRGVKRNVDGCAVDLRQGIRGQLIHHGVRPSNIDTSPLCSFEEKHLPSARRDGPTHANTLTVITRQATPYDLRGKRTVIYGLGVQGGGEAAVRYALQHRAVVTAIDAKPAAAFAQVRKRFQGAPVRFAFGPRSTELLKGADVIIKNPGVPMTDAALQRAQRQGAFITSDIDLFRATTRNPILAITGTKGKTTVATWLAALLRTRTPQTVLAGNVRHSPLLEKRAYDGRTPVVLELSSFQLESLTQPLAPVLALITNLFPDHLDRHRTMRSYATVKSRITAGQNAAALFIAPLDSEWQRYSTARTRAKTYWTSDKPQPRANAFVENTWIVLQLQGKRIRLVPVKRLRRRDLGTVRSAVSTALAGYLLGVPLQSIRAVLLRFPGVSERYETVRVFRGRTFINNTTATNPAAAVAGIASVTGRCIVIAGGAAKGLPNGGLIQALNTAAGIIFLPGTATKEIAPKVHVPSLHAASMAIAVRAAYRLSQPGDTILLSPGAASFGLFRNEFDRGRQFVAAVRTLR